MARKVEKPTFEKALDELEKITRALESGDLTLDDSIKSYEKGMELRKICLEMLEKAEKKLEYLEKKESGEVNKYAIESDEDSSQAEGQSSLFSEKN